VIAARLHHKLPLPVGEAGLLDVWSGGAAARDGAVALLDDYLTLAIHHAERLAESRRGTGTGCSEFHHTRLDQQGEGNNHEEKKPGFPNERRVWIEMAAARMAAVRAGDSCIGSLGLCPAINQNFTVYPPRKTSPRRSRRSPRASEAQQLRPWLLGRIGFGDEATTAAALGLSPAAIKAAVHRLRARVRPHVKAEALRAFA
jgi:hypothetical protein